MNEKLQASLKKVMTDAENLIKEVGDRTPTEAENKQLAEYTKSANELKAQIDENAKNIASLNAVKAWQNQGSGSQVAAAEFSRQTMGNEGDIPGVGMEASGELYALDGALKSVGDEKLKSLKSGIYKDAFAEMIRAEGLKRPFAMKGDAMKILNEGSDPSGGFWVPPDFRPELQKRMAAMTVVRPNAKVYTTGTDHITFPAVNYTGVSADDALATLFTSGVRFTWRSSVGSTTDITEATNPVAGQNRIPVNLATAAIILTREQLEDNSFDILGYITDLGAEAFALGEESSFTNGTGAGQPRGYMSHPSFTIAASTTGTVAGVTYTGGYVPSGTTLGSITWSSTSGALYGITGMEGDLPPQYENNAKWYGTKKAYSNIRQINAGTATLPQWSLGDAYPNYGNSYNPSLLGYPIRKNQFMPSVANNNFPLAFGDMSGYVIADRVGLSVEVFREVYGLRDQVVVYMRKRVGGDLVQYWKLRAMKLANS